MTFNELSKLDFEKLETKKLEDILSNITVEDVIDDARLVAIVDEIRFELELR